MLFSRNIPPLPSPTESNRLFYIYFREIMLDKKQIQVTFLFEFKMSHKAVEATYNISNSLDPGMAKYSAVVIQEVVQRRQEP